MRLSFNFLREKLVRPVMGLGLLISASSRVLSAVAFLLASGSVALPLNVSNVQQDMAERALMQGQLDQAVNELQNVIAGNPHNGTARLLLCRAFYAEDQIDEAISACESAVQEQPNSSEAQDWLGRAYGIKAGRASLVSSFQLARKVRAALEAAVELDPSNGAAVNDLSEFYIAAPALIGGGLDRASALAARVEPHLPQQAHRIRALIAEKKSDFGTAEREFQAAVEVANQPSAWADLGEFYAQRKEYDKAEDALQHCLSADRLKDASIVDAASTLNEIHREPQIAERALRQYLEGHTRSDAAPAPKVEVMLARMLAADGDRAGAKIEVGKALELASNYDPARRELQALQHG